MTNMLMEILICVGRKNKTYPYTYEKVEKISSSKDTVNEKEKWEEKNARA